MNNSLQNFPTGIGCFLIIAICLPLLALKRNTSLSKLTFSWDMDSVGKKKLFIEEEILASYDFSTCYPHRMLLFICLLCFKGNLWRNNGSVIKVDVMCSDLSSEVRQISDVGVRATRYREH